MQGFKDFIQKQGVVGVAVAFIMGAAILALVNSFVDGLINPILAALFNVEDLAQKTFSIGEANLAWGAVIAATINFIVIAAVVYYGVKWLKLDDFDKEEDK